MSISRDTLALGLLAICVNAALMLVKITTGVLGNSYALIADGIESASDIFSSLITWAGFQLSLRPPDENHPYGHGKIESLAGMFSGCSLIAAAGVIANNSIQEILTPHHAPAWFTLLVLIVVVIIKEVLSRRILAVADSLDSAALKGDAWHHRSDAITSAAAGVGIAIALIGGKGFEAADDWGALVACVIITINGVLILRGSLHEVLDGNVDALLVENVKDVASGVTSVIDVEKCRIRKSGIAYFVELHVQVASYMAVQDGHTVGHQVKSEVMKAYPRIADVTVHLEPCSLDPKLQEK